MIEQRTAAWYALRAGKFTGSRLCDLMAETKSGPAASRRNLLSMLAVERLTGQCVETYENAAMVRGRELEAAAREAYECERGVLVEDATFVQHPTISYVGASPDGFVGDDGLVELKCPSAMAKHVDALRSGAHATEYRWQLQGQLWVTGRAWVDAVSYDPRFPEGLRLAITRVSRDEVAIKRLEGACIKAELELQDLVAELSQLRTAA
jgi:putative phage-type endonuclease